MAPTIEELGGCVAECRVLILGKELEVNVAKYIVIVVGSRVIVLYSEKCLCGVCRK